MCNFASFIVHKDYTVTWFPGIDSHDEILRQAGIPDDHSECIRRNWAKVEIVPPNNNRDHRPLEEWSLRVDECTEPEWFDAEHRRAVYAALALRLKAEAGEYSVVDEAGNKYWSKDGNIHREEYADGTKEWWKDGKLHREDGPVIE